MTGEEPPNQLPKMYHTLQRYARHFKQVKNLMPKAYVALEEHDVTEFERIRSDVVDRVDALMHNGKGRLLRSDTASAEQLAKWDEAERGLEEGT